MYEKILQKRIKITKRKITRKRNKNFVKRNIVKQFMKSGDPDQK